MRPAVGPTRVCLELRTTHAAQGASRTGNTAKMAQFIAEGAQSIADTEVRIRSVDDAKPEDVFWCEGLAVGSPTNLGLISWRKKRFLRHRLMPVGT